MKRNFVLALASLIGTIIGAGIFAVPFTMAQSGIITCFFYFLLLGLVVMFLHLFFAEVILRTKGRYRLAGLAEKYLGKNAKAVTVFATAIGTGGALLAYVILAGRFAYLIWPVFSTFSWSIIFWFLFSFLVFLGIKSIASVELWLNLGLFLALALVFIFCLPKIEAANFTLIGFDNLFLPFGVILFGLMGTSAIPEAAVILKNKKQIKKVIIIASLITVSFSALFGLLVSGVTGPLTTGEPFAGLSTFLGRGVVLLGGFFGLLAISSSFLVLANYLKNSLRFDLRLPHTLAFILACGLPLFLFLIGFRQFISVIGLVGTVMGLIEGIIIVLLYKKAKQKGDKKPAFTLKLPRFLPYFIIAVLALGALVQLLIS